MRLRRNGTTGDHRMYNKTVLAITVRLGTCNSLNPTHTAMRLHIISRISVYRTHPAEQYLPMQFQFHILISFGVCRFIHGFKDLYFSVLVLSHLSNAAIRRSVRVHLQLLPLNIRNLAQHVESLPDIIAAQPNGPPHGTLAYWKRK